MNEAVFKTTVMGGFNKSEVLAFIDKQDSQYKEREKDLTLRINSINGSLNNETQENSRLKQRVAELESQLETEKNRYAEAQKKLQDMSAVAGKAESNASGEIERRDAKISSLTDKVKELEDKASRAETSAADAAARISELEKKLSLIDKTEDQIGRAMLEAQKTADKIVENAKNDAESLLSKAHAEAQNLTEEAKDRVCAINSEAQKKLDAVMDDVADYKKRVESSREETADFFESIDSMFAAMQKSADNIQESFSDAFKSDDKKDDTEESEIVRKEAAAVNFDFRSKEISD